MLRRTLFFQNPAQLSLKNNKLIVSTKESRESMAVHIRRVRSILAPSGKVSILAVTDKQYGDIVNYWGKIEAKSFETPQQLELF